jgi:hypothetical protein
MRSVKQVVTRKIDASRHEKIFVEGVRFGVVKDPLNRVSTRQRRLHLSTREHGDAHIAQSD